MTIHEETMRELCMGADWQRSYARNAEARAEELTALIGPAEERLTEMRRQAGELERELAPLRRELEDKQQAVLRHDRFATEFRELARQQCQANGWELPAATTPGAAPAPAPLPEAGPLPGPPRAVADMVRALPTISVECAAKACEKDPSACAGCSHDCHWLPAEQALQQMRESAAGTAAGDEKDDRNASAVWTPRALAGKARQAGRHARGWRPFPHRAGALIQPEVTG